MTFIKAVKINKKTVLCLLLAPIVFIGIACFAIGKGIGGGASNAEKNTPKNESSFALESGVVLDETVLDEKALSKIPIGVNLHNTEPTVLIIHTHISEEYADGGGVKDAGDELARLLAERYGISVVHDVSTYDTVDGKKSLDGAYQRMEDNVLTILEKYNTIEVIIDLHRDAIENSRHIVCRVDGKDMAPLMLVNGACTGEGSQENPYLNENLALSLKMHKLAQKEYNGLFRRNYIKPFRYSTHMKPCSVLVEVGYQTNSLAEAKNSLEPFADTLVKCIESK